MLKLCYRYEDLNIEQLLNIYAESTEMAENERRISKLDAKQDFCDYLQDVFFTTQDAIYLLWQSEERYVSALRLEPYLDGYLLSGLETAPDARQKGYASQLMRALVIWASEQSIIPIYSHVSKKNKISRRVHEKTGFLVTLDYAKLLDGTVSSNFYTFSFSVNNRSLL